MTTMRAVRAHARGEAEQLRLEDVPKPEPRASDLDGGPIDCPSGGRRHDESEELTRA